jgi:hypothetical protein
MDSQACLNCGALLSGRWCAACGQRAITDADRGLGHLIGDFLTELTSLESRTWLSFWALLAKPGELSRAYLAGARLRYLKPISLFLIVNLVYFLAPPLNDFNLPLSYQSAQPWHDLIMPVIERHAADRADAGRIDIERDVLWKRPIPGYAALADDYAARSGDISKLLIIVHVPFLALGLMLGLAFRRLWYAEHFVVALHLFAWTLLLPLLLYGVSLALRVVGVSTAAIPFNYVAFSLLSLYCLLATRRAYGIGWGRAVWMVVIALPLLFFGHFAYRFVQATLILALV